MRKVLIIFVLALTSSCSTSQSAVAEATDPDVVSRAPYTTCNDRNCDYYAAIHNHIDF